MTMPMAGADSAVAQSDVINDLAGVGPGSPLAQLRAQRPEATRHTQGSYDALFDPADVAGLSSVERLATAVRVATVHAATELAGHYRHRLTQAGAAPDIVAEAARRPGGPDAQALPPRLRAMLRHADLLAREPAQANPDHLQALADAGLATRDIVTVSQIIAFVSFQLRVLAGLRLLDGAPAFHGGAAAGSARTTTRAVTVAPPAPPQPAARVLRPSATLKRPSAFTVAQLEWAPWLPPLDLADATPQQAAALEGSRGNSPYFRLLAYDVAVLTERTATDRGIFYTHGGAPRAERELAAAATSRLNGCIYCASVHARLAAQLSKRSEDIDRLLREGVTAGTQLGLDERWQGVVDLAVALAATPPAATSQHVARLRAIGLSDLEILDVMQAAAFFSWANRLMLTLGEPYYADQPTA